MALYKFCILFLSLERADAQTSVDNRSCGTGLNAEWKLSICYTKHHNQTQKLSELCRAYVVCHSSLNCVFATNKTYNESSSYY